MRPRSAQLLHATAAIAALALSTRSAAAQRQQGASAPPPALNAQARLPYAAADSSPVSRWTPPASVGRQLTLTDLLTWKQIRSAQLSNDGQWFAYELAPNEGDAEVVIRGTSAGATEWRFPVGDASGGGATGGGPGAAAAGGVQISGNSRWVAFLVHPTSAARARSRPGGAPPTGATPPTPLKLAVVNLADGSKREFENVRAFRFAGDRSNWLAIHHAAPAGGAAAGGAASGGAPTPVGSTLELVDLAAGPTAPTAPIANVSEFAFDDGGEWLAYAISVPDRIGNSLQLRQLATGLTRALDAHKATYRRITWGDSSTALAAYRVVTDTGSKVDETVTALLWPRAHAGGAALVIDSTTAGLPPGKVVSGDYAMAFGRGDGVLYVGVRAPRPPRPRTTAAGGGAQPPAPGAGSTGRVAAAPQTDADVPSLVLWHWKDARVQSAQQVQEAADRNFVHVAAYQIASTKLVPLTDDALRGLQRGPRDTWAIATDDSEYQREAGIRGFNFRDIYAVNVATGERKLVQKKVPGGGGGFGFAAASFFSPDNSKYAYYDTGDWKVYDFASGATKTVNAGVDARFWDVEDDHNQVKPAIGGGFVGWTRDNASIIVRDNWDYWRLPVNGSGARNLTVDGARDKIRYQQRVGIDPRDRRGIDPAAPLYVERYGEYTKREGLVQVNVAKGGVTVLADDSAKVDYRRARDAAVWAFTRQSATVFPDWHVADDGLKNPRRLTDANPQQKEVAWTPGARLVEYTCDGSDERRQATLYLPAGYQEGRTYPMLTYIYEKLSQGFHAYAQPNATRYANPAVYTSRGYAYLMPDITYKIDDPGMSAVWCVVPAVKAAIATGLVDSARVGLQGHSWGGYQTSFITTQTNIFKTAVAGAPLTDMTSMFGSIYWNSGNTDGSIFIASQGRFTGGPNEVPEAYARNSPQVHAQKLAIPFMILHNDRDGAVDFNQGITYYNHLRQLGKEVVLLEYVGENHGLQRPANQKDYALRMTEWFDTFLRDQPAPQWLTDGIPRLEMEAHLRARKPMVDPKAEAPKAEAPKPALVP